MDNELKSIFEVGADERRARMKALLGKRLPRTTKHEETVNTADKPMRLLEDMNQFEADHQQFLMDLGSKTMG